MPENTRFFPTRLLRASQTYFREVPSITETREFVDDIINFLFPIRQQTKPSLQEMEAKWAGLQEKFSSLVKPFEKECTLTVKEITHAFFKEIPLIHVHLLREADSFQKNDPAAYSPEEIILSYPGFYAIAVYRLAHVLYNLNVPILPRAMSTYAHGCSGIDIHPGAKIGEQFYIDHGTGIVIGETTVIGKNVKIYQGVTLGALYVSKRLSGSKRHPTIEDNVIMYAGSTILGGETVVGHSSVIGGNVWLTESVPPYSVVTHKPEIIIQKSKRAPKS